LVEADLIERLGQHSTGAGGSGADHDQRHEMNDRWAQPTAKDGRSMAGKAEARARRAAAEALQAVESFLRLRVPRIVSTDKRRRQDIRE
jgi:hypothetical protein